MWLVLNSILGNKTMVVTCDDFKIVDSTGKMLMSVTKDNVTLGIDDMRYQGILLHMVFVFI